MNPYIMLGIVVVLLLGAVARSIEWRKIAVKWVSPDPQHATVFIKDGVIVTPVIAERDRDNELIYNYKIGKNKLSVTLPVNYPMEFLKSSGRRIIGVQNGIVMASPLGFMTDLELKKYRESPTEIGVLVNGQVVVKALRSISETKNMDWIKWAIIAVVGLAAFYMYSNKDNSEPVNTNNQTSVNQPAVTPPPGNIIIIPPETVTP